MCNANVHPKKTGGVLNLRGIYFLGHPILALGCSGGQLKRRCSSATCFAGLGFTLGPNVVAFQSKWKVSSFRVSLPSPSLPFHIVPFPRPTRP